MTADIEIVQDVDALGLLCPLPVLRAAKRMRALRAGQVLLLRTDDPAAIVDVPHYCAESGHRLIQRARDGKTYLWWIRRT